MIELFSRHALQSLVAQRAANAVKNQGGLLIQDHELSTKRVAAHKE